MSKTASYIKDRYNAKTYDKYVVYLRKDDNLNTCLQTDKETTPISQIIKEALFMFYREKIQQSDSESNSGENTRRKAEKPFVLATKRQRRAAIKKILLQLQQIKYAEEISRDNIPENLQGSINFEAAEECINALEEALELLDSAY